MKSERLAQRFFDSKSGKLLNKTNSDLKEIQAKEQADLQNKCCTPSACIEIVPELLEMCVKGGFCSPNFEVCPLVFSKATESSFCCSCTLPLL